MNHPAYMIVMLLSCLGVLSNRCVGQLSESERINVIAKASRTSVCIFGPANKGGGSGVLVSADGYALTNYHVIESCDPHMKCGLNDGNLYDAVIVGIDATGDVALIKLLGRNDFPFANLGDSDLVQAGDECFSVGNPFLLATDFQPSVSWGIISGKNRYQYPSGTLLEYADCIQTDAAVNPGNSGGALFDRQGMLIGINGRCSFEKRGRVNVGVGYAISINQIRHFWNHLKSGRLVDHASFGAIVSAGTEGGVVVSEIVENCDAFQKGLRLDDEIVSFGGRSINSVNEFKNVLGVFPKGWVAPITFTREGQQFDISVRLASLHNEEDLFDKVQGKNLPAKAGEQRKNRPTQKADRDSEQLRDSFVARRGYANYFFNELERDRVWSSFQSELARLDTGTWLIDGLDANGRAVNLILGDEKSGISVDNNRNVLEPRDDLARMLSGSETESALAILYLWRKLLLNGPKNFGKTDYFGSLSSDASVSSIHGADANLDCLVSTYESVKFYALFDKTSGLLVEVSFVEGQEATVCSVTFDNYKLIDEVLVPETLSIRRPFSDPMNITIQHWSLLQ